MASEIKEAILVSTPFMNARLLNVFLFSVTLGLMGGDTESVAQVSTESVVPDTPPTPAIPTTPPPTVIPPAATPSNGVSIPTFGDQIWMQIKDSSFEGRTRFFEGVAQFQEQMDAAIKELKAKRPLIKSDPKAWDSEMNRLDEARAYLASTASELKKATASDWDDRKEKLTTAWARLKSSYARARELAPAP